MKLTNKGVFIPKNISKRLKVMTSVASAGSEKIRSRALSNHGSYFGKKWYPEIAKKTKHSG